MSDDRPPHFVPVDGLESDGRLSFAGRALCSSYFPAVSGDGLWRERGRADGGTLFLHFDVESKGPDTVLLRETLEEALGDEEVWDLDPGDLLVELHNVACSIWADTNRSFVAQAVLVQPSSGRFLVSSAAMPYPYHAPAGEPWLIVEAPSTSPGWLGRPDIHEEGPPTFPAREVRMGAGDHYLGCSDGVIEAGRPRRVGPNEVTRPNLLGPNELLDGLNAMADRPPLMELLDRVFSLAAARDGDAWPGDDATAIAWRLD
jgi:hypothetical protein